MELKKATQSDIEHFIKLEQEFDRYNQALGIDEQYKVKSYSQEENKKDYFQRLRKKNLFFYFAVIDSVYVGYIYGYIVNIPVKFRIGKVGYLDGIMVSKEYRGKKIASKLKDSFLSWLKKNEVELCQIHVAQQNKTTYEIYKNWGFKTDEVRLYKKL